MQKSTHQYLWLVGAGDVAPVIEYLSSTREALVSLPSTVYRFKPGMVAHTCYPNTPKTKAKDQKFKVILSYRVGSRPD